MWPCLYTLGPYRGNNNTADEIIICVYVILYIILLTLNLVSNHSQCVTNMEGSQAFSSWSNVG